MSVHKDTVRGTWYFRKRVNNIDGSTSNIKRSGFKTKKEAQIAELNYGKEVSVDRITMNELCNDFINTKLTKLKSSTLYGKRIKFNKYIIPYFGEKNLKNITMSDIAKWQNNLLSQNLSIDTVNRATSALSQLFDHACLFYDCTINPVKKVGRVKDNSIKKNTIQIWTEEEFQRFITEIPTIQYKTFFSMLYYTGLRIGEALALTWEDLDIEHETISINKSVGYGKLNVSGYVVTSPKTKNAYRTIDLPYHLIKTFKLYINHLKENKITYKNDDFIFGISRPLSETNIRRIKNKACDVSGVKQIRIHDFRHTHASQLIEKGIDPLYVKERLGHDDISTTLNVYSHLFDTRRNSMVKLIKEL